MGGDDTKPWDLVVVVPGIGGSVLERNHTDVWDLDARTVLGHLWNRARAIESLTLPRDLGDEAPNDDVVATRLVDGMTLVPGIWEPIDGYRNLIGFLEETVGLHTIRDNRADGGDGGNLLCFAYDWRLSNRYNATRLKVEIERALKRRACLESPGGRGVALICHSMGGLIARYFLDVLAPDAPVELLVTLGTPHRGALKALDVLSNGIPHLYGRTRKRLTAFVRSLPSVHQLLPEYACINAGEAEPEWFDAATCGLDSVMASDSEEIPRRDRRRRPDAGFARVVGGCVPDNQAHGRDVEHGRRCPADHLQGEAARDRGRWHRAPLRCSSQGRQRVGPPAPLVHAGSRRAHCR